MATQHLPLLSEEEYLTQERAAEFRSEFIAGEVFAMSGGSQRHSRLAVRVSSEIDAHLREKPCHVFSPDMRVRTPRTGAYLYPDVSVVCGEVKSYLDAVDLLTNPLVIVEVLSPSTANYDRGEKFELYREFPSLQDYLLIHTENTHVEYYARQADGSWLFREYRNAGDRARIASIEFDLDLGNLYKGVAELPR